MQYLDKGHFNPQEWANNAYRVRQKKFRGQENTCKNRRLSLSCVDKNILNMLREWVIIIFFLWMSGLCGLKKYVARVGH